MRVARPALAAANRGSMEDASHDLRFRRISIHINAQKQWRIDDAAPRSEANADAADHHPFWSDPLSPPRHAIGKRREQ